MQLGFQLALMGMGTVFAFLILLIIGTTFMSKIVMAIEAKTKPATTPAAPKAAVEQNNTIPDALLTAIITAAIQQHRASKK